MELNSMVYKADLWLVDICEEYALGAYMYGRKKLIKQNMCTYVM
jgi:hypothetical protein